MFIYYNLQPLFFFSRSIGAHHIIGACKKTSPRCFDAWGKLWGAKAVFIFCVFVVFTKTEVPLYVYNVIFFSFQHRTSCLFSVKTPWLFLFIIYNLNATITKSKESKRAGNFKRIVYHMALYCFLKDLWP